MLSNTAETKPSPSAVCQDAAGSFSTGIIDAQRISESRNTEPLNASGSSFHSGTRQAAQANSATQTAAPMNGKLSEYCGNRRFTTTLAAIAASRMMTTIATRAQ